MSYIQKSQITSNFDKSLYEKKIKILHEHLLNMSKEGIIKNANAKLPEIINNIYAGDEVSFKHDLLVLKDAEIISFDGYNIHMLLSKLDNYLVFCSELLITDLPIKKSMKPIKILNLRKFDRDFIKEQEKARTGSFKVPQSLIPYITGELLSEKECTGLTKEQIQYENYRRSLPKYAKLYYLYYMSCSNSNGICKDFNIHYTATYINSLFDYTIIPESNNCYKVHRMLLDYNLVREYIDSATQQKCLEIVDYKLHLEKKDRYIAIPHSLVFNPAFISLPAASVRVAFYFLSRLNNGENAHTNQGSNKKMAVKLFSYYSDTVANLTQYYFIKMITRRRTNAEIFNIIKPLFSFFNFESIASGCFNISIKEQFFIAKKNVTKLKTFSRPSSRYPKKAATIFKYLDDYNIRTDEKSREEIIQHLHRCSSKIIRRILFTLKNDIEFRTYNSRQQFRSISAYTLWLYKIFRTDRELFLEKQTKYIEFKKDFEDTIQNELMVIRYKKYDYNREDIVNEINNYKDNYELSLEDIS